MDLSTDALPGSGPATVSLSDPGEIAAGLPHLIGFRPEESAVLISLAGDGGSQVGLTARADLPPPAHVAAFARALVRSVCTDRPSGVLLVVVSEAPDEPAWPEPDGFEASGRPARRSTPDVAMVLPHQPLVHEVLVALAERGVPLRDTLLVRGGRWWSYDCPHPCCGPGAGTPLPSEVTPLEVASIVSGLVAAGSREELEARIDPPRGHAWLAMGDSVVRIGREHAAAVRERGAVPVAGEARAAVESAAARCRPDRAGGPPLSDDEIARLLWGLRDPDVRDHALRLALGEHSAAMETLWTECTRRAPAPLDAAPATLLAVSAWLRGDGAMANVALQRALDGEPGYPLARLLSRALADCLTPAELRAMIRASVPPGTGPTGCDSTRPAD
ncbi:MAG: DUF4192 domain-containing protein [Blastococcus sp.]